MSNFLYDTMTGSDGDALTAHTPEIGGSYSIHPSASQSPIITSNRARGNTSVAWVYNTVTPPNQDYTVEGFWRQVTDEVANAGVQARLSPTTDDYYIARYSQDGNQVQLRKVISGGGTSLGTFDLSLANGDDLLITFVCTDAVKLVYVNNVLQITSFDNTITSAGVVGVRWTAITTPATQGMHLDYLRASVPDLPASSPGRLNQNVLRPRIFAPGIAR